MGDVRYGRPLEDLLAAQDRAGALQHMNDDEVVQALAALAARPDRDPYLANVLATEAMNRVHRSGVLARTAAEALVSIDREGRVTDANPAALRALRVPREELVGHPAAERLPIVGDNAASDVAEIETALLTERSLLAREVKMQRTDGETFDALLSIAPIRRGGMMEGAVLLFIDISERKRLTEVADRERARLYRILDHVTEGVLLVGPDGMYRYLNPSAGRILGVPGWPSGTRALQGRIRRADGRPLAFEDVPSQRALVAGQAVHGSILRVERDNGKHILIEIDAVPILDADGKVVEVVCSFDDVTERKHAEERSALLTALVESSSDAILLEDLDGTIREWNAAAAALLGYRASEIVGTNVRALLPPDRQDELVTVNARVAQGEIVPPFETERVAKDGTRVPVSLSVSAVRDREGHIVALSATYRDIRQLVEQRRALAESEERYRSLFENDPVGVFTFDESGTIVRGNRAAFDLVGYAENEIVGRSFVPLLAPQEVERAFTNFVDVLEGNPRTDEYSVVRKDGSTTTLRVTGIPIRVGGRIVGMHGRAEEVGASTAPRRIIGDPPVRVT